MPLSSELIDFVKASLERGQPRDRIEDALLRAGWPVDQVKQALGSFAEIEFPIPVPRPATSASRDAFMYVVMFATLTVSAYSLGNLLFALIDRAFPDPAAPGFPFVSTMQAIRWPLSSLIVAFPVFLSVAWLIERSVRVDPTKRASRIRRQLTYVTLLVAAAVLIGDVTSVVYNFLGGELTVRFMLKVLTVGIIAGTVFGYYLTGLRTDEKEPET